MDFEFVFLFFKMGFLTDGVEEGSLAPLVRSALFGSAERDLKDETSA